MYMATAGEVEKGSLLHSVFKILKAHLEHQYWQSPTAEKVSLGAESPARCILQGFPDTLYLDEN